MVLTVFRVYHRTAVLSELRTLPCFVGDEASTMKANSTALFYHLHGQRRRELLKLHRLAMFELAFDAYLAGEIPASTVTIRAKKMLQAGLPRWR